MRESLYECVWWEEEGREGRRRLGRSQGLSSELPMVLSSRLERQLPFSQSLGMVVDGRVDGGDG